MIVLDLEKYHHIVFLTGAGISVASGLRPYRGPGGLWDSEEGKAALSEKSALTERPKDAWQMFGELRQMAARAEPNDAHRAIAKLDERFGFSKSITVITQNVDRLHQRAGSRNVIELHGSILRTRCMDDTCKLEPFDDDAAYEGELPRCPKCHAMLRPDVVLFNELLPVEAEHRSKSALRDCDLFIAVGTSGTVAPASTFVRSAEYAGARTILVNLEPMLIPNASFKERVYGKAEEILPQLLG